MVQAEQGFRLPSTAGDSLDWPMGSENMREDLWQPAPSHTTTAHSVLVSPEFWNLWGFAQTTENISFPSGWPDTAIHNRIRLTWSMYLKEFGHLEPNREVHGPQESVSAVPRMALESKLSVCLDSRQHQESRERWGIWVSGQGRGSTKLLFWWGNSLLCTLQDKWKTFA